MIINCPCGYSHTFNPKTRKWEIKGSDYGRRPTKISDDIFAWNFGRCGSVTV